MSIRSFDTNEEAMAAARRASQAIQDIVGPGPVVLLMPAVVGGDKVMTCHVFAGENPPMAVLHQLARQGLDTLATWMIQAWSPTTGVVGDVPHQEEYIGAAVAMEAVRDRAKGVILIVHRRDDTNGVMAMIADGDPTEFKTLAGLAPGAAKVWADKMMATIEPALTGRGGDAN